MLTKGELNEFELANLDNRDVMVKLDELYKDKDKNKNVMKGGNFIKDLWSIYKLKNIYSFNIVEVYHYRILSTILSVYFS